MTDLQVTKSYHSPRQSFESDDNSTMRIIYIAIQVRTEKRMLKEIMVLMHAGHDNVSCHFTIQRYNDGRADCAIRVDQLP